MIAWRIVYKNKNDGSLSASWYGSKTAAELHAASSASNCPDCVPVGSPERFRVRVTSAGMLGALNRFGIGFVGPRDDLP